MMSGGEVVEEVKGEVGMRFSRDEIKVDFVKGAHALVVEGVVLSWVSFLLSVSRVFFGGTP